MKFVALLLLVSFVLFCKMSDTQDDSVTLDYSYYDAIDPGVSLHDHTFTSLDFDPDNE